jgi:hypothetical protein
MAIEQSEDQKRKEKDVKAGQKKPWHLFVKK